MKGKVKWYNYSKGYGFIETEDGTDIFVHRTALPLGKNLSEGDEVEYELEQSDQGPRAVNIQIL